MGQKLGKSQLVPEAEPFSNCKSSLDLTLSFFLPLFLSFFLSLLTCKELTLTHSLIIELFLFTVSRKAITLLWRVFNDIADGFGISKEELEEICSDLKDEINVSRLAMTEKTGSLFGVLDTDRVRIFLFSSLSFVFHLFLVDRW